MPRRTLNGTSLSDRIIATNLAAGDFARSLLGDGNDLFEGSAGGDQAFGDAGNDALYGRAGNDSLVGGAGNDTLDGGEGDDTLDGGTGNDTMDGGNGDDALSGGSGANRMRAGAGNDRVTGGDDGDMIWGDAGNDTIHAGGGNNWIYAGEGHDSVTAGDIGDMIWGDAGDDTINAGGGNNWVYGGEGRDSITAGDIGDWLYGDAGDDTINAGGGNNWVYGGAGADSIRGGMDNDMLFGDAGDDTITDGGGQNHAYGGDGQDRITLGTANDFAHGDAGNDTIQLGQGNNAGYGGAGQDSITSGDGLDQLYGEDGNDTLQAGRGQDQVLGGAGNDLILQGRQDGTPGQDHIRGGAGTDTLRFLFTTAEWFNSANQAELARLAAANATPAAQSGAVIASTLFGLNFAEIEALSVSVNGTILTAADDRVTARADSFDVLEGGSVSGSVVANDTVPDLIAGVALRGAAPSPGSFSLSTAGVMSFNSGTSFEHLAAGQVATLSFTYRVTDADGDTGDAQVTLRITGTNDAASISGTSTGAVAEDGTLAASGTLSVADADAGEARFATPASLAGTYGSFSFNATSGLWGYALNNAAANVQALNAGQSGTDTLTVTSLDGTASRAITVTIAGRNDAASIGGTSTGSVAEDGALTAGGTLSIADVDAGQARFAAPPSLAGTYGSFTFDATSGAWGYTLNNAAASVQALAQGQTVQDTLTVTSLDGTDSEVITVSIAGANDAPVNLLDADAAANTVLEGAANGTSTGVTMGATDPEGGALTYSFQVGGLASATDASGAFAIDASTGVITLANGALLNFEAGATRSLTVFARDAQGAETSTNLVITLTDRDETPTDAVILSFDDVPGGALGDGGERPLTDYAGFTFSQAGIYNPDGSLGYATSSGTTLAFFAEARNNEVSGYPGVAGSPLVVARADGTDFDFHSADFSSAFASSLPVTARAYDDGALVGQVTINVPRGAAPNFDFGDQYPGQRFTSIDRLEFTASDYFGLDDFAFGNVTAIIGGTATGAVAEDGTLAASGTLSITDPDPGQAGFATPAALAGIYGSFTFDAVTGDWSYALDNAAANVQALAARQVVNDVLNVTSLDGSATQVITVAITGVDEVAVVFADVQEDGTLTTGGTGLPTPGPTGYTSGLTGTYGAFTYDAVTGAWTYTLNNSAANVQALVAGQTVTDTLNIGFPDQVFTVRIAGADEGGGGGAGAATLVEDGVPQTASGMLSPLSGPTGSISPGNTYGAFTFNGLSGAWSYTLDNASAAVQALKAGQSVTDMLTVSSMGITQVVTITVNGSNDTALITGPSTGSVAEDGTLTASGTLTITDVDAGEAAFATPASLAGTYGSFTFNAATGAWGYALNGSAANVQALSAGQVVTDVLNVASLDGTASQAITVSINGAGAAAAALRIDLSLITPAEGFIIQGDTAGDSAGRSVASAGDVNGDGFADLIIGAPYGSDGGAAAGEAYVVFGGAGGFGTTVAGRQVLDLTTLSPTQGFIIQGDVAGDRTGYSVASAGDVNGDGFADLIVGATLGRSGSVNHILAGTAHVVFGGADGFGTTVGARQVLDMTTLDAAQGFTIRGRAGLDETGKSVASAGDVNGDGFADVIVGAPFFNISIFSNLDEGAAYLIFGGAGVFGSAQTVAGVSRQLVNTLTLTAGQGSTITNGGVDWNTGRSVSSAGDVNGDGLADLILGAPVGQTSGPGQALVVFGSTTGIGTLQSGTRFLDGLRMTPAQGFVIEGDAGSDKAGFSVSSAGDVNGDGFADLIVGAHAGDDGGSSAGEAYVVFGAAGGPGTPMANSIGVIQQVVKLTTLTAAEGFIIQGDTAGDSTGWSVASAGDVNGDGFADVIVGAPQGDDGGTGAGEAYVLFGGAGGFGVADATGRQVVDLTTLTASQGFIIQGDTASDSAGWSVSSAGDVNGDGFGDLIVGASGGDDGGSGAGEAYVLYGAAFGASTAPVNTTGTSAADILMGGAGNDSLSGGGGADALRGGAGNDRLGVADSAFRHVDGGAGTDTLVLTGGGQMLDLTTIASGRLTSIEAFDLTGTGDNTLVIRPDDIFVLGGAADAAWTFSALPAALVVDGNAGDTLELRDQDPDGAGAALNRSWVQVLSDVTLAGAAGGAYDIWELQAGTTKLAAIAAHADLSIL